MYQWREHVSKEETFIKWVKRLRLSAFTTSQPRTFFWLWLMLVMWCYEYIIQFIVMVPSSSYYIIRTEILILQWNKAGMTFLNWNQLWLWNLFAILNVRVLCRWSCSTMTVPAPTWFWYSPACTSFIEMESHKLGWRSCSGALAAWSGPRLGTSRSSTSPSRSPSTLYKVFVRLPGRVSQFLHQYRQY